jgi:5,10-methylenetetrahydromethanopterin reductase
VEVGFFFWPYDPELVRRMAAAADRYGYDMIGIADTPGNAMDPWVAATMVAQAAEHTRIALCVTNLVSRHPAVSAAAIASLDLLAPGRAVLGIGAGHSGTRNLGMGQSEVDELEAGLSFVKTLLAGKPARLGDGSEAHLPWIRRPPKLFLAGSGPKTLRLAGRIADGAFVNFGIAAENLRQSEATVIEGARQAGRDPQSVEQWQIASLDCNEDGAAARAKAGAILAFMAGGYIFKTSDLAQRGVPVELREPIRELRRRYSTRPGDVDAKLVDELGLFDYLAKRFAIFGTPDQCLRQLLAARDAGLKRVMFTVSVASDPARTVELFGERMLPVLRSLDGRAAG